MTDLSAGKRLRAELEAQVVAAQDALSDGSGDEFELEWEPTELAVLAMIEDTADRVDALKAIVDEQGMMIAGSKGQQRLHPALQEERMARDQLGRLLDRLKLPAVDEDGMPEKPKSARHQRAVARRWGMERAGW